MRNMLTNEKTPTLSDAMRFFEQFTWDSGHIDWFGDLLVHRRIKLIARQYCAIRERVQQMTSLESLIEWMVNSPSEVLTVPMNMVDNRRRLVAPTAVRIRGVYETDVSMQFRFLNMEGEMVEGMGWSGEMLVLPPTKKRFDETAWRFGLASYGIYLNPGVYEDELGLNMWVFSFGILKRDFDITDANNPLWQYTEKDDPATIDRAEAFELGFLDDEIFGDGYAR